MTWQEVKEEALSAFKQVIDAYLERGYEKNAEDEERTMILIAAEIWPQDIHPIAALIVLDSLLEDGKCAERLLEYADGRYKQCYSITVNHIRELALRKHRIDVHCGDGGFTAQQLSDGSAYALIEEIWRENGRGNRLPYLS